MKRRAVWGGGSVALLAVWAAAAGVIWFTHRQRVTAEKTMAYLDGHPLAGRSAADRQHLLDGLADRVNALSFEERQKLRQYDQLRAFFAGLTDAERARYLDRTLPHGMQQIMQAFNDMSPAKRKQIVNRAVSDLQRFREEIARPEQQQHIPDALSDQQVERIIDEGMKSYLSDASAETKLDLQPLLEQIQNIMQQGR